jgi:MFS family permease
MFGMFFMGALYMQRVLGYKPLTVGFAFLPATIFMGLMSLKVSDRVNMRFGPRSVLIPSLALLGIGLLLFARTPVDGNYFVDLMPPMILLGIGAGLAFPAVMMLAMSGVEMSESGLASGLVNTSVQVGGAIGLAVLATLSSERTENLTGSGDPTNSALNSGYHLAYLIGAVLVGFAIVIAVTVLKPAPMPQMEMGDGDGAPTGDQMTNGAGPEPAYSEVA